MAEQPPDETVDDELAVALPPDLRRWVDAIAEERGVSRTELVRQTLAASRAVSEAESPPPDADLGPPIEASAVGGDRLVTESALDERIDALEAEFAELVEDVRERTIQVKREADDKADAEHAHPDLAARLDAVRSAQSDLAERVEAIDDDLSAVDDRVDQGFENYREVLDYLTEAVDDLEERCDALAAAVVSVRDDVGAVRERARQRRRVDILAERANERGVRQAACESCGTSIDVALLSAPRCPSCEAPFGDVEPKDWLFGSPTLLTDDPPALEGGEADERSKADDADREDGSRGDRL